MKQNKTVEERGFEISQLDSKQYMLEKGDDVETVHIDEIIQSGNVVSLKEPRYSTQLELDLLTNFETADPQNDHFGVPIEEGSDLLSITNMLNTLEEMRLDFFEEFSIDMHTYDIDADLHLKVVARKNEDSTMSFSLKVPTATSTIKSRDTDYLEEEVKSFLFGVQVTQTYLDMFGLVKGLKNERFKDVFDKHVRTFEIKIFRTIHPTYVKEYVTKEARERMTDKYPEWVDRIDKEGFCYLIKPTDILEHFGGNFDTKEHVSEVWTKTIENNAAIEAASAL